MDTLHFCGHVLLGLDMVKKESMTDQERTPEDVKPPAVTQRELIINALPDKTLKTLAKIYEDATKDMQRAKENNNFVE